MGDDWKVKFVFLKEEGVEVVYFPRTLEISSNQIKRDLYDADGVGERKTSHDEINTNSEKKKIRIYPTTDKSASWRN